MIGQIILQIILIALNALFACTEVAVISISDVRLEKLAASGNKKAVKLKKLTDKPTRFLATIQVAITLAGFIGAAFAADSFSEMLTSALVKTGIGIPAFHARARLHEPDRTMALSGGSTAYLHKPDKIAL